jgi:WD40 repeat protein
MVPNKATKLSLADNKDTFAVGFDDGRLLFGSLHDEKNNIVIQEFSNPIESISFSRDSNLIIASEKGGNAIVWDFFNNTIVDILPHKKTLYQCEIISKGHYVTVDIGYRTRIWKYGQANELQFTNVDVGDEIDQCMVRHGKNEIVFLIGFNWLVWDIETELTKYKYNGIDSGDLVRMDGDLEFSKNGEYLIVYWDEGVVFNTTTGILTEKFARELPPVSIRISDSGKLFGIGSIEGSVAVQEINNKYILKKNVSKHMIEYIDMTNDGKLVSFVDESGYCGIINVKTGERLITSEIIDRMI